MKRLPLFLLMLFVITSMAWVAGCRSPQLPAADTGDLMTRVENPDLNDPYGGYNMKDEAPGFGDPSLVADYGDEAVRDYPDPFANDRDVTLTDHAGRRIFLMITWGNLERDSTIQRATDWSGSLSVDPGILVLKRVIRFEPGDNILPRTQRDLLEWESKTQGGVDGILVRVVPRPVPTAVDTTIDSSSTYIRFSTAPVKVEFTLDQLPGLHRVITLPDGNAVAFNAVKVPMSGCPHGFLHGGWFNHPERPGGRFHGRWASADGNVRGILKGVYGVNDSGERVLFGKMIGADGRFEGIVRGTWAPDPGIDNGGWFRGRWVDRRLRIKGELKGHWQRSQHCNGGFFRGEWVMNCDA